MLDGHETFWRIVVALMLIALAGVAYLAYQLRPRPQLATELARNYKPQPKPAAQEQAVSEAPTPPAPAPVERAAPAPQPVARAEASPAKAAVSGSGIAGTPLRRFLPLGSGFDEAQLSFQLGVVLASLSRHEEAVRAYGIALDRAPQNSPAWIGLGVSFEALGKRSDALNAYRRALSVASIVAEDRAFAERRVRDLQ